MPAKRKEVSPAGSPEKAAGALDKPENTLQQYLNVLSIADGLATMKINYDANMDREALRFFAMSVMRKLSSLNGQYQYNKDSLMCIFHLIDLRFNRPTHDPQKPFLVWVRENNWATKLNMRPVQNQEFIFLVLEEMDKMFKQHFSSQRAEDITEGVNEVLNDLVYECILEVVVEDPAVLNACIRHLESELFFFEWIIEAIVKNPDGVNYCIRRLESQVYDIEYQLFEILRDLAKA